MCKNLRRNYQNIHKIIVFWHIELYYRSAGVVIRNKQVNPTKLWKRTPASQDLSRSIFSYGSKMRKYRQNSIIHSSDHTPIALKKKILKYLYLKLRHLKQYHLIRLDETLLGINSIDFVTMAYSGDQQMSKSLPYHTRHLQQSCSYY